MTVNSKNFYYSCYSNLSPCFSGLGYCRNSNLLDIVGISGWCWFWIVSGYALVSIMSIWWIRIPWGIIVAFVLVISGVGIAESTVEERFTDRLFPRKELFWAVRTKLFPIPDGWDIWSSPKNIDSVCRAYEVVIFPKLLTDIYNLVVEVIPPTFC